MHLHGDLSSAVLFAWAVCIALAKAKVTKKSKTCTVVRPKRAEGTKGWLDREGVTAEGGKVVVFKRVSKDWKTQEGTPNETTWAPGTTFEHPAWNPKAAECGPGKFHACSTAYFCDEFRSLAGDRYVALEVKVADMHAWDGGAAGVSYRHKVAIRAGRVLHECDRFGKRLVVANGTVTVSA